MSRTRRSFTTEYKVEAAHRVIDSGRAIAEVARELGVNEGLLGRWVADERRRVEAAAARNESVTHLGFGTTAVKPRLSRSAVPDGSGHRSGLWCGARGLGRRRRGPHRASAGRRCTPPPDGPGGADTRSSCAARTCPAVCRWSPARRRSDAQQRVFALTARLSCGFGTCCPATGSPCSVSTR